MDKTTTQWGLEPFRKFATFSGRAPRAEYWYFYLLYVLVGIPANFIDRATGAGYASGALLLVFALPFVAVAVRRIHDGGRSGWWLMLPIAGGAIAGVGFGVAMGRQGDVYPGLTGLPLMVVWFGGLVAFGMGLILLIWLIGKGTDGPNRFGPDPLDRGDDIAGVFD